MSDSDSLKWDIILASIHSLFKGSIQPSIASYSSSTGKNLKLFIDFEEQDYNERVAATRRGVSKDRSLPCQMFVLFFSFFVQSFKLPSH
jgi:hypothetical protein